MKPKVTNFRCKPRYQEQNVDNETQLHINASESSCCRWSAFIQKYVQAVKPSRKGGVSLMNGCSIFICLRCDCFKHAAESNL